MGKYHIAQINIAQAKGEMETKIMHGFVSRLDEINAIADTSPGFVWRLQSENGDSTSFRVFNDPLLLVNMSIWETIEDLKTYVYKSMHVELIRDREAWFNKSKSVHQALWWVPAGYIPTLEEAKGKLKHLQKHGATKDVFTFGSSFKHP